MKTLNKMFLALLFTLIAPVAHADSLDLTKVLATVEGVRGLHSIALLEDGRLQVKRADGLTTVQLSEAVKRHLNKSLVHVASADIKHEHRTHICHFSPQPNGLAFVAPESPELSVVTYSYDTNSYQDDLHIALTSTHCALYDIYYPENDDARASAKSLQDQLVVLALNATTSND